MPQDTASVRSSDQTSETEVRGSRQWLTQLLSDCLRSDRGKLTATAALALLRGRVGRRLLGRLGMTSVLFVYRYLIIIEVIVGFLVLSKVATRLILLFIPKQAGRGASIGASSDSNSSNDVVNHTGPNIGGQSRQNKAIQKHLQRLAMEAAAAGAAAANVAPSLLHHHQHERLTVECPERKGTTLAVTTFKTGVNSPVAAVSRQTPSNPDSTTIVTSQHRSNLSRGPGKSLQDADEQSVVIHFQLPVYVCNLTFWNDIQITVPSSSRASLPPSWATAAKSASDATGPFCHSEMKMWMEMNCDMVAIGKRSKKPCEDCLMGSHSVGKRRFTCTYLDGCLDEALDVHKNTFHAGSNVTILGSNSGLNFKLETALEQILARPGSNGPATYQQRVTFALLSRQSEPNGQSFNCQKISSKVDGGSLPKREGGSGSGPLAAVFRRGSSSNSTLIPVAKCSMEAIYTLEDRRVMQKDYCENSQLNWIASDFGLGERGLDARLFGSTISSSS